MESNPVAKPKTNRTLLIAGIAVLLCLFVSGASALCLTGIVLFGGTRLKPAVPAGLKATVLATGSQPLESPLLVPDPKEGVHLFWISAVNSGLFHISTDRNGKWSAPESPVEQYMTGPSGEIVARTAPDGRLCIFWYGMAENSFLYGWLWRCREGSGWSDIRPVPDPGSTVAEMAPAFASDGSLQFVYTGTDGLLSGNQLLSANGDRVFNLRFVIDGTGGWHVAWQNDDRSKVRYRFSADGGTTWQPEEILAEDSSVGDIRSFDLIADQTGGVQLFWIGGFKIFHQRYASGAWGGAETAVDNGRYPITAMSCAVNGSGLAYIFWERLDPETNGEGASLSRQNSDRTWGAPVWIVSPMLGKESLGAQFALAVDSSGKLHFAWLRMRFSDNGPAGFDLQYALSK